MSIYIWVDYILVFPRPDHTMDASLEVGTPTLPRDPPIDCGNFTDPLGVLNGGGSSACFVP